ncbi:glutaredoxin family protein [Clostridium oryzae]|uniref:Glutaredoxin-3 n=1 Tax=Clostridium oryzae TaxID=1450648 RepID=A0A1V4INQ8_9CLOT|nr:glutaredoxin family protein [Clostridium oryzae]OPJ61682.1 glutaredoxin-3 [Clostridium oryzae]
MSVTVYTTSTCPWCVRVKDYLKNNSIPYTEKNVSADRNAAMEMINKSGQRGVPVIDVDGNIVVGFDKPTLDNLLKL